MSERTISLQRSDRSRRGLHQRLPRDVDERDYIILANRTRRSVANVPGHLGYPSSRLFSARSRRYSTSLESTDLHTHQVVFVRD